MKKLMSLLTSVALMLAIVPTVAMAGGSAATLDLNYSSPSGYIAPGTNKAVVMVFDLDAWSDLVFNNMTLRFAGSGADDLSNIKLYGPNGEFLSDCVLFIDNRCSMDFRHVMEPSDIDVFWVSADIDANADVNATFRPEIVGLSVVKDDTDLRYSVNVPDYYDDYRLPHDIYLAGNLMAFRDSPFLVPDYYRSDVEFSYVANDPMDVMITSQTKKVFEFDVDARFQDVYVDELSFRVSDGGQNSIDALILNDGDGDVVVKSINGSPYYRFEVNDFIKKNEKITYSVWLDPSDNYEPRSKGYVTLNDIIAYGVTDGVKSTVSNLPGTSHQFEFGPEVVVNEAPFGDIGYGVAQTLRGKAALWNFEEGIVDGFVENRGMSNETVEFRGDKLLNRAEAVKFVVDSLKVNEYSNRKMFTDVNLSTWYSKYISTAYDMGIVVGFEDGTFRPRDTVTKAQFLTMLAEAHNLPKNLPHSYKGVKQGSWYNKYLGAAVRYNLFPEDAGVFDSKTVMNRWGTSIATYELLAVFPE